MRFAYLLVALFLLVPVLAEPNPAAGLTEGNSSRRDLSNLNTTSVSAMAGNVTQLDINSISITRSWQGYYGNITGNMVLSDANNNSLYEWGNATGVSGEIYAARSNNVSWGTINCSTATHISQEESYLGIDTTASDSVNNTYSGTAHPSFLVGTSSMSGCPSTNVFVNGSAQSSDYHQILLADGNNVTVYTTIIDSGSYGYDGNQWDFQLLVAENGQPGNESATTYYFYTELS